MIKSELCSSPLTQLSIPPLTMCLFVLPGCKASSSRSTSMVWYAHSSTLLHQVLRDFDSCRTSTSGLIIISLVLHNLSMWRSKLATALASTTRMEVIPLVYDTVAKENSSLQCSFLSLYLWSLVLSTCVLASSKRPEHACRSYSVCDL